MEEKKRKITKVLILSFVMYVSSCTSSYVGADCVKPNRKLFAFRCAQQYMASVEQQLLGTETVRAMRARGVQSRICGLSANDMEDEFKSAGSDTFWMKPFPCKKDELTNVLGQVLGVAASANL